MLIKIRTKIIITKTNTMCNVFNVKLDMEDIEEIPYTTLASQ
jgi:hypothetical protein